MRYVLLPVAVLFTAVIAVLTVLDMVHHGVSWIDILALLVVLLFATGLIGSLLTPPPRD
jgi:hypothetical protein